MLLTSFGVYVFLFLPCCINFICSITAPPTPEEGMEETSPHPTDSCPKIKAMPGSAALARSLFPLQKANNFLYGASTNWSLTPTAYTAMLTEAVAH